jgi:hypothetical protein
MGLLAASATLNLPTKKAMAILPQNSPLQVQYATYLLQFSPTGAWLEVLHK